MAKKQISSNSSKSKKYKEKTKNVQSSTKWILEYIFFRFVTMSKNATNLTLWPQRQKIYIAVNLILATTLVLMVLKYRDLLFYKETACGTWFHSGANNEQIEFMETRLKELKTIIIKLLKDMEGVDKGNQ
uniref:uncharacterized protein LOC120329507 n=1 Tax=Styela clava TaxID=7725 RepID=UPI00193A8512|nr:uncharacterized protein LOC120329507 [Styela clava]